MKEFLLHSIIIIGLLSLTVIGFVIFVDFFNISP